MQLFQDNLSEVLRGGSGTVYQQANLDANAQPGGNTGQLQYNNGNVFGGVAGSNYDGNNLTLGNVANLRILGGTTGQVLTTDGTGVVTWANVDLSDAIQPQFAFNVTTTANNQSFSFNLLDTFLNNAYASVFRNGLLVPASDYTISGNTLTMNVFMFANDEVIVAATGAGGSGGGGGGNTTPGGGNTMVQYNDQGLFNGSAEFTFNEITNTVSANKFSGNGAGLSSITASNVVGTVGNAAFSTVAANANFATLAANANFATLAANANYAPNANSANFSVISANANFATLAANANYAANSNTANTAGTVTTAAQPNITSLGTLSGLTVNGETLLGPVGNVTITGGLANQYLQTDGSGNLTWSTVSSGTVTNPAGSNRDVQFNNNGVFGADTLFHYDDALNQLSVPSIVSNYSGNGTALFGIQGSNISGAVGQATLAVTVSQNAQPNITSVGTLSGITVNGVSNLTAVGNVRITGGATGQFLQTDGTGNLSWANAGSNNTGVPGGVNTYVQFNDAGSFGGINSFTFNKATNTLTVSNASVENHSVSNLTVGTRATLGTVGNVRINGGVAGYVLQTTDGAGNLIWVNPATIPASTAGFANTAEQANTANSANTANTAIQANTANSANSASFAGIVVGASQPNISSLGVLSSLTVAGVSNFGSNSNVRITGGSNSQVLTTDGTGNLRWTSPGGSGTVTNVATEIAMTPSGTEDPQYLGFSISTTPSTLGITTVGNVKLTVPSSGILRQYMSIGNVANSNFTGNSAQVLIGSGTWAAANLGTVTRVRGNGSGLGFQLTGSVTSDGNLNLVVPLNTELRSNLNIGNVANLNLSGNAQQYLRGDGTFTQATGTAGGSNTQVQYNNAGSLAGNANLTFDSATGTLRSNNLSAAYFVETTQVQAFTSGGISDNNLTITAANNVNITCYTTAAGNINLGKTTGVDRINLRGNTFIAVANLKVTGGSLGQALTTDGTGNLQFSNTGTVSNVGGNGSGLGFSLGGTVTSTGNLTLTTPTDTTLRTNLNIGNVANANFTGSATTFLRGDGVFATPASSNVLSNIVYGTELVPVSTATNTGTINMDVLNSSIVYYTTASTGSVVVNFRGNSTTTFNSLLAVNASMTMTWLQTTGSTAYGVNSVTIDGVAPANLYWAGGSAPSANTNSVMAYTFTVVKTAATPTYRVFGTATRFA